MSVKMSYTFMRNGSFYESPSLATNQPTDSGMMNSKFYGKGCVHHISGSISLPYLLHLFWRQFLMRIIATAFACFIPTIISIRAFKEMVRCAAKWMVTCVTNQAGRIISTTQGKCDPVCSGRSQRSFPRLVPSFCRPYLEHSIADGIAASHPWPASGWVRFIDVAPEGINPFLSHWKNRSTFLIRHVVLLNRSMCKLVSV
jgi:hypothetical protein